MAETREVVVTIKSHSLGGTQPPAGSPASGGGADQPQSPEISQTNNVSTEARDSQHAMTTIAVQLGEKAIQEAVSFAISEIDYRIQRGFYLKDDYIGQRNYSIAKSQITNAASSAFAMGAALMTGNPAIIGMTAIAQGVKAVRNITQYVHAIEMQDFQIKQLDANLQFNRTRAGYSLTAGSIGENR